MGRGGHPGTTEGIDRFLYTVFTGLGTLLLDQRLGLFQVGRGKEAVRVG